MDMINFPPYEKLRMLKVGVGKMFTFHKNVFIDPKVVYDVNAKTTNLTLGFGLRF